MIGYDESSVLRTITYKGSSGLVTTVGKPPELVAMLVEQGMSVLDAAALVGKYYDSVSHHPVKPVASSGNWAMVESDGELEGEDRIRDLGKKFPSGYCYLHLVCYEYRAEVSSKLGHSPVLADFLRFPVTYYDVSAMMSFDIVALTAGYHVQPAYPGSGDACQRLGKALSRSSSYDFPLRSVLPLNDAGSFVSLAFRIGMTEAEVGGSRSVAQGSVPVLSLRMQHNAVENSNNAFIRSRNGAMCVADSGTVDLTGVLKDSVGGVVGSYRLSDVRFREFTVATFRDSGGHGFGTSSDFALSKHEGVFDLGQTGDYGVCVPLPFGNSGHNPDFPGNGMLLHDACKCKGYGRLPVGYICERRRILTFRELTDAVSRKSTLNNVSMLYQAMFARRIPDDMFYVIYRRASSS